MERMDIRLQLLCSETFVRLVDVWRGQQPDVPNRSEAIRRLVLAQIAKLPKKRASSGR
jgi:hypothetical protein